MAIFWTVAVWMRDGCLTYNLLTTNDQVSVKSVFSVKLWRHTVKRAREDNCFFYILFKSRKFPWKSHHKPWYVLRFRNIAYVWFLFISILCTIYCGSLNEQCLWPPLQNILADSFCKTHHDDFSCCSLPSTASLMERRWRTCLPTRLLSPSKQHEIVPFLVIKEINLLESFVFYYIVISKI